MAAEKPAPNGRKPKPAAPNGYKPAPASDKPRCPWCLGSPAMIRYHDREWGRPVKNDRLLFEMITLEGAQAGLSWSTILNKRENYRRLFAGFDPVKVARFRPRDVERLMQDAGIVRNRLKIESTIGNARAFLEVQKEFGSFSTFIWGFVGGKPLISRHHGMKQVPVSNELSDALSKELKTRGFRFVGSTICYTFMQAVGMVDDHLTSCFRYALVCAKSGTGSVPAVAKKRKDAGK